MKNSSVVTRNYWSMVLEGGFYFFGWMMFDVYIVIPVFVYELTGDLRLAGLAATLRICFSSMPQLLMGHLTPRIGNLPRFIAICGLIGRTLFFTAPIVLLTDAAPYLKVFTVYLFVVFCAISDGTNHVPWLDLVGRTIPSEKRGKLLGYQQLLGGIGGIIGGYIIKAVLAKKFPDVSTNYSILFFIGATSLLIAGILLFFLKDNEDRIPSQSQHSFFDYFKQLPLYFRSNKRFATLIITQCLFSFNGLASPLYIIFAKTRFHFLDSSVTSLMIFQLIGGLAGGLIWGYLSYRMGNKFTIQVSIILNIAVAALAAYLALFDTSLYYILTVVVIFCSGILLGAWLGFTNALFDVVKEEDQPIYIAIASTLLFPLAFITFIGGILADLLGFSGVFLLVVFFMLIALFLSLRLKMDEEK